MTKTHFLFFIFFMLFSCQEKVFIPKPEKVISPDKMTAILVDYYLSDSYNDDAKKGKSKNNHKAISPSAFIYKKYQIDSLQFISNINYYLTQEDVILTIFNNADKQLKAKKTLYEKEKRVNDSLKKIKNKIKQKQLRENIKLEKAKHSESANS